MGFDLASGHLVHGERTDWIPRLRIILETGGEFVPFDRFAQTRESVGKSMMAKRYRADVGPWIEYLRVLDE